MAGTSHACEQNEISRNAVTVDLLRLCIGDPLNEMGWSEFLRRTHAILLKLVRRASRRYGLPAWLQASDIVEDSILKLLENNRALLRRFHGETEGDFVVYLAVICRSCIVGHLRREAACKRSNRSIRSNTSPCEFGASGCNLTERQVLAREIIDLARLVLKGASPRDRLIYHLYFYEDSSIAQIAQIRGIGLSPSGVRKVISGIRRQIVELGSLDHAAFSGERTGRRFESRLTIGDFEPQSSIVNRQSH